jgi:hypothetical protein
MKTSLLLAGLGLALSNFYDYQEYQDADAAYYEPVQAAQEYVEIPTEFQRIPSYGAAREEADQTAEQPAAKTEQWGMPRSEWLKKKKAFQAEFRAWKKKMGPAGLRRLKQRTIRKGKAQARREAEAAQE